MDNYGHLYGESPSFQDSFMEQQSVKKSNESLVTLKPNDTFHADYQVQGHPSFQEKNQFANQLAHQEYSYDDSDEEAVQEDIQINFADNPRNYIIQHRQQEENNEADETYTDTLPENFFEQLKPQTRQFNINFQQNMDRQQERKSLRGNSTNNRSTSLKKRMEQKNEEMLYTRAVKMQICQNLVQQQIDKEIKYMSNSKKMSQNSYRIVAKKLEDKIQEKMVQIDPTFSKILTFSQIGRLLQMLNLFTVVKFDANSQIIIEENQDPHKQIRFAQETMFHQQFWFFVVNYINKDTVLGEIVFSTLRILMDPMQLTIKETKDFLAQYMGRTLAYLEEDRKAAQVRTLGFQLWTLEELIRAFRQLNEQRILREKSQNINTQNTPNKKSANSKVLDKNIYTFKPVIDKNSQLIDEMHRKKFAMNTSGLDAITPIRNSNATTVHNTKSIQSTKKLINLLQSSQSYQNLHSQASLLNQLQPNSNTSMNNNINNNSHNTTNHNNYGNFPTNGHLNHNSSTLSFLSNAHGNQHNYNSSQNPNQNANTTMNTDLTTNSNSVENSHMNNEKLLSLKVKSLISQHQHPSRSNLNQSNTNSNTYVNNGYNHPNTNHYNTNQSHNFNGVEYDQDENSNYLKIKRCATLSSFQIPEEDYVENISLIPSNNFDKAIDRVNMILQKKQQTEQKINRMKEDTIQQEMRECTFQPQILRSVSPQYSAYQRNQKELVQRQQHDINKRQQAMNQRNQIKKEQDDMKLSECTFKPSLSPTQRYFNENNKSPLTPKGYEQTVHRMRAAQDKQRMSKVIDQGSYTTRASTHRTSVGRSSVSPRPETREYYQTQKEVEQEEYIQDEQPYDEQPQIYHQQPLYKQQEFQQKQHSQTPSLQEQQSTLKSKQNIKPQEYFQQKELPQQEKKQLQNEMREVYPKENQQQIEEVIQNYQENQEEKVKHMKKKTMSFQKQDERIVGQEELVSIVKPKPFFVLDIITPSGEKAPLELCRDDDIYEIAESFSRKYQLDEITQSKIEQILDQQMQKYIKKRQSYNNNNNNNQQIKNGQQ